MFDPFGPLVIPAEYDEEGVETQPERVFSSWHVNCSPDELEANPALADYVVTPSVMQRVWLGDDHTDPTMTVALRFTDETEYLAVSGYRTA